MKHRYKFVGAVGNRLFWQCDMPGDSRVFEVKRNRAWFYSMMIKEK